MGALSIIFGIVAALSLILGLLPLFGWLNWLVVLPPAILGLICGALSKDRTATTLSAVVAGLMALRLMLGRLPLGWMACLARSAGRLLLCTGSSACPRDGIPGP